MDLDKLVDELTEAVMVDRGYDRKDPLDRYEWDADSEDSQYSLIREDMEFVVDLLDERGLLKSNEG